MNANKHGMFVVASVALATFALSGVVSAAPLDAHSTTKINNAKAQAWSYQAQGKKNPEADKPLALQKQIVNMGSRKDNTCNMNVGTVQGKPKAGQRAPKEIIVTAKDVINVCK
jgi:hypothetical protein